ncbi:AsnC family transcriptional regulator, partial [Streptomyces sp. NPDC048279]|uniref:AsnC family transcriptional regulator n=1 Tax=Streptomyces sp. NPDC048279 TaxID=3154714 RepID=UPI003433E930
MEELDRQIVQLLVKDGRMSYTDLGKATGLSTSAVHQRVRRLEQRGVIRGYAAVVSVCGPRGTSTHSVSRGGATVG